MRWIIPLPGNATVVPLQGGQLAIAEENLEVAPAGDPVPVEVQTFESPFGKARAVIFSDGTPWFVAKDVLEGLGFTTAHGINGCIKHLLSDQRMTLVKGNMTNRVSNPVALKHLIAELFPMSIARVVLISRGGFNDLVLESRKPVAREYRQWVTDEVLPALGKLLRKGAYFTITGN